MSIMTRSLTLVATWLGAALLVTIAHAWLDRLSLPGGTAAVIASIAIAAWIYMHFCAPRAGVTHALGAGIVWLVLAIIVEIAVSARIGHGWYGLLGSPGHPLLRSLFLFVWIFAPAVFARGAEETAA
jgi:hypothetical protein